MFNSYTETELKEANVATVGRYLAINGVQRSKWTSGSGRYTSKRAIPFESLVRVRMEGRAGYYVADVDLLRAAIRWARDEGHITHIKAERLLAATDDGRRDVTEYLPNEGAGELWTGEIWPRENGNFGGHAVNESGIWVHTEMPTKGEALARLVDRINEKEGR